MLRSGVQMTLVPASSKSVLPSALINPLRFSFTCSFPLSFLPSFLFLHSDVSQAEGDP